MISKVAGPGPLCTEVAPSRSAPTSHSSFWKQSRKRPIRIQLRLLWDSVLDWASLRDAIGHDQDPIPSTLLAQVEQRLGLGPCNHPVEGAQGVRLGGRPVPEVDSGTA